MKLLVVRVKEDERSASAAKGSPNILVDSRPCVMCVNLLSRVGIRTIYHSTAQSTIRKVKISELLAGEIHYSKGLLSLLKKSDLLKAKRKTLLSAEQKRELARLARK